MTTEEFAALMKSPRVSAEYLKFARVQPRRSQRMDLHAFLLLDELVPGPSDIVSCAEHDEIWLAVSVDELAAVVTPEQVIELHRCGVRYDSGTSSLALFV